MFAIRLTPSPHRTQAQCSNARLTAGPSTPANIRPFKRHIADKVHSNLQLRNHPPQVQIEPAGPPTEGTLPDTCAHSLTRLGVASAMAIADLEISLPHVLVGDDVIITGKKHKMQIFQEYKDEFGAAHPKSIITQKKVSTLMNPTLYAAPACCRQSRNTIESKN